MVTKGAAPRSHSGAACACSPPPRRHAASSSRGSSPSTTGSSSSGSGAREGSGMRAPFSMKTATVQVPAEGLQRVLCCLRIRAGDCAKGGHRLIVARVCLLHGDRTSAPASGRHELSDECTEGGPVTASQGHCARATHPWPSPVPVSWKAPLFPALVPQAQFPSCCDALCLQHRERAEQRGMPQPVHSVGWLEQAQAVCGPAGCTQASKALAPPGCAQARRPGCSAVQVERRCVPAGRRA